MKRILPLGIMVAAISLAGYSVAHADDVFPYITLNRIAIGSCASEQRAQPIWDHVLAAQPDAFLFLGDNIYADTTNPTVMQEKYGLLAAQPGFQKLKDEVGLILATWDDHDYGKNDAGGEYSMKVEAQEMFHDFWGTPADSPRRDREGIYYSAIYGPAGKRVQIIMLDTRYHRSRLSRKPATLPNTYDPYAPLWDKEATMLGEEQWAWLEEQLRKPAEIRLIGSSIQFVVEEHWFEKWANLPYEKQRMIDTIKKTGAQGVIFVSGDRHLAELSVEEPAEIGYRLYDLTSSGLNQGNKRRYSYEVNSTRVGTMNRGDNFGMVVIEWDHQKRGKPAPRVRFQIVDGEGDMAIQRKVPFSFINRP